MNQNLLPSLRIVADRPEAEASVGDRPELSHDAAVAAWAQSVIPDDGREHGVIAVLDTRLRLLGWYEHSIGTANETAAHPVMMLRPALLVPGAHAVVIVHNHPSGDPRPSREDIASAYMFALVAELHGLAMLAALVVTHAPRAHARCYDPRGQLAAAARDTISALLVRLSEAAR
jgi:DNA repair protein RadC